MDKNQIRIVEAKVLNYMQTIEVNGKHVQPTIYNVIAMVDDLGYLRSRQVEKTALELTEVNGVFQIGGKG